MNSNHFLEFQKKYPNLFKDYPRSGFYLQDGWKSLVETLCAVLEDHISKMPSNEREAIYCAQVKSKFGSLRFYMTHSDPYMDGTIAMAETLSSHICEKCGVAAERRNDSWVSTLCDVCYADIKSK